jgi:PadR family transcriptional regulator PadR
MELSDGAVYPILRKLKNEGLLTTRLSEESGGPPRKYYRMTETGHKEYEAALSEWQEFADAVEQILKGEMK